MRSDGQIVYFLGSAANLTKNENLKYALFLRYDDLIRDSEKSIRDIYNFLNIPYYSDHYFKNLSQLKINGVTYNENMYGKNLHKVNEKDVKKSFYKVEDYLPEGVIKKYSNYTFW